MQSNIVMNFNKFSDTVYAMCMYFKPPATEKTVATCHVTLFGCRTGGDLNFAMHCTRKHRVMNEIQKRKDHPRTYSLPGKI